MADGEGKAAALDTAVRELYRLDPAEFTARRDALAARFRKEGDAEVSKEVKALKRPSLPAWAVNALALERPDELTRLLDLGDRLREAQARLSGDELRRLTRDRQQVIAALAAETRELAAGKGHDLTEAALRQVEETLTAALTDQAAATAVTSGRLVRPLEHAGIGPVELEGAVGGSEIEKAAGAGSARAREEQRRAEADVKDAQKRRREVEGLVASTAADVDRLEGELDRARRRLDGLQEELEQASSVLRDAEARLGSAGLVEGDGS